MLYLIVQLLLLFFLITLQSTVESEVSYNNHHIHQKIELDSYIVGANTVVSRLYPPSNLISYRTTLTDGDYVISSSGFNGSTHSVISTFDGDTSTYFTSFSTYSSTSGKYMGTTQTATSSGTVFRGEYIQIQLPVNISLTGIIYSPRDGYKMRRTSEFSVLGSVDGYTWSLISTWTSVFASPFLLPSTQSYMFNWSDSYTYYDTFRIVQSKQSLYYLTTTSAIQASLLTEPVYYLDQASFNGSTCKYAGYVANGPTSYMTISMWINSTKTNVQLMTMSRSPSLTSGECSLSIDSSGKLYYWEFWGSYGLSFLGTTIPLNTRVHVAFVKNNTIGTLYVNGVTVGTQKATNTITLQNYDLCFGCDYRDKAMYLKGTIENAYLYNYAMTASEIQSIYYTLSYTKSWEVSSLKLIGTTVISIKSNYQTPYYMMTDYAGSGNAGYNNDNLPATSTNLNQPHSMWYDTNGHFYITDYSNQRIRKLNTITNKITTIAGTGNYGLSSDTSLVASSTTLYNPAGIWISTTSVIYFADSYNHRIRQISTAGIISTVAGSGIKGIDSGPTGDGGAATSATIGQCYGIVGDASGNIFFSESIAHKIRVVSTLGSVTLYAGTGTSGYTASHDGGPALAATLSSPYGLALDTVGNLYIAEKSSYRIRKITVATKIITTVAGSGSTVFADGVASSAGIASCESVWVDSQGTVYFTDYSASRIRKVSTSGIVSTIAGTGTASGITSGSSVGAIGNPLRLWGDSIGNIYFYDQHSSNYGIFKIAVSANIITRITKNGDPTSVYTVGVVATSTQVSLPNGMFIDSNGVMYLGSKTKNRVLKLDVVTVGALSSTYCGVENTQNVFTVETGTATSAKTGNICATWGDTNGNIYFSDCSNYRIRKIDTSGIVSIMVGSGSVGYYSFGGDGGPATAAYVYYPFGVIGDSLGKLYFTDSFNRRVRMISATGIITTIAGGGISSILGDGGQATQAYLNEPRGIFLTTGGTFYIAELSGCRIRKVVPSGIISTIVGSGSSYDDVWGDGSPATSVAINRPTGVWMTTTGILYTVENSNHRIRQVDTSGIITTLAGKGFFSVGGTTYANEVNPTAVSLYYPIGIWYDTLTNTLYVGGDNDHMFRKVLISTNIISIVAGSGSAYVNNAPATSTKLTYAHVMVADTLGNLYYTEYRYVRKITNGIVTTIAGTGSYTGSGASEGLATSIEVNDPGSIIVQTTGVIYFSDQYRIRTISISGYMSTLTGTGNLGSGTDGGLAISSPMGGSYGLLFDTNGVLYFSESNYHKVRTISTTGILGTFAGTGTAGYSSQHEGIPATSATLYSPNGLWIDSMSNFYIADTSNHRIRKITTSSGLNIITTFAGSGSYGLDINAVTFTAASFYSPTAIAGDTNGIFYVLDRNNHRVRKLDSITNKVTTFVGRGIIGMNTYTSGVNDATSSGLNNPTQVMVDSSGTIYVTDSNSQRIRKIVSVSYPTSQPTGQPSRQPTAQPSRQPTLQPSGQPSRQPSHQPTGQPSLQPTVSPTSQPSFHPSSQPSSQPTITPSAQPSTVPTRQPTNQPSFQPSMQPSHTPTKQPIAQPSCQPTQQPSNLPTAQPSMQPTSFPSSQPSGIPSRQPSQQPTRNPSSQPSSHPTSCPSRQPSSIPSLQPTIQPSNQPTNQPSVQPSKMPTCQPSRQPTTHPTYQPTDSPTLQPTTQPSMSPSQPPTNQPSTQPTVSPTVQPTTQPSSQPSKKPSTQPSSQPSSKPTSQPSTRPTRQPSSLPTTQPSQQPSSKPSEQPSAKPSLQPFNSPTGQPTLQPSRQPSGQPSVSPSVQPTTHPSMQPTVQPTRQPFTFPTTQPSVEPSTQPSSQPSKQPSSSPTSVPTIDSDLCPPDTFYLPEANLCSPCPLNSFQRKLGSKSCTCNGGYRQSGFGNTLNCSLCPHGYFANAGNATCHLCPSGYAAIAGNSQCTICSSGQYSLAGAKACEYCAAGSISAVPGSTSCSVCPLGSHAALKGSTTCALCPQGFYADQEGQTTCTTCGTGKTTPTIGTVSSAYCVNPGPNFMIGGMTLIFCLMTLNIYIVRGRLQNIAFERKVLYIYPLAKVCCKVQQTLDQALMMSAQGLNQTFERRWSSRARVLLFVVVSIVTFTIVTILQYLILFYKAFYNALFMLRGLTAIMPMPSLLNIVEMVLSDAAELLRVPFEAIEVLFYPAFALVNLVESININLDTINVTCLGSQAPLELLINFMILGVVMSILMSGYQYLWLITFPNLTYTFLKKDILLRDSNVGNENRNQRNQSIWNALLCCIGIALMFINPFEGIIRFLLTLVSVTNFFSNRGIHPTTPSCNDLAGMKNVDLLLAVSSSMIVWWLMVPFIYTLSELLVPKCVLRKGEVIRYPHEDELLLHRRDRRKRWLAKANNNANKTNKLHSVVPTGMDENNITYKRRSHFNLNTKAVEKVKFHAKWKEAKTILGRYKRYGISVIQFWTSIDIVIISIAKWWLAFLGDKHGIKEHKQTSDFDSSEETEDIGEAVVDLDVVNTTSASNSIWVKMKDALSLSVNARLFEQSKRRIDHAKDDLWKDRSHVLSSYSELCVLVAYELSESETVGETVASILAWSTVGHLLTRVGRIHWKLVIRKFSLFLQGCVGIWTDDVVASFAFEEVTTALYLNNSGSLSEQHDKYRSLLYINIGMRSMIFQMIPGLSVVSVVVAAFASTPLFVKSKKLKECLPQLILWNARDLAMETHFLANGLHSSANMEWLLIVSTVSLFILKSRLFAFIANFCALTLPIIALNYSSDTKFLLILVLVALFPFVFAQALNVLALFGRQLGITDRDFKDCFYVALRILCLGMLSYSIHSGPSSVSGILPAPPDIEPEVVEPFQFVDVKIDPIAINAVEEGKNDITDNIDTPQISPVVSSRQYSNNSCCSSNLHELVSNVTRESHKETNIVDANTITHDDSHSSEPQGYTFDWHDELNDDYAMWSDASAESSQFDSHDETSSFVDSSDNSTLTPSSPSVSSDDSSQSHSFDPITSSSDDD